VRYKENQECFSTTNSCDLDQKHRIILHNSPSLSSHKTKIVIAKRIKQFIIINTKKKRQRQ